jgi:BlaI family penicillinase repressor
MARKKSETLTPREVEIMEVLWALGSARAEEVRGRLEEPLHDSTVRTLLRVLEAKGYATHSGTERAYVYRPSVPREQVESRTLRSILKRFFGGSAEALVIRLIEDEHLTLDQLDRLRRRSDAIAKRQSRP